MLFDTLFHCCFIVLVYLRVISLTLDSAFLYFGLFHGGVEDQFHSPSHSQVASLASTAPGASKESWPCLDLWATTRLRSWTWSSPNLMWWPLTWTNCSPSSWSWHQMACGTPSVTRRRCVSSASALMSLISVPRASYCRHFTVAAQTTSQSWWLNLKRAAPKRPSSEPRLIWTNNIFSVTNMNSNLFEYIIGSYLYIWKDAKGKPCHDYFWSKNCLLQ